MRKITERSAEALYNGEEFKVGNTVVRDGSLYLHGNEIASLDTAGAFEGGSTLVLRDAGWQTTTTKERLNGILEVFNIHLRIFQRDGEWLIQNTETLVNTAWTGEKTIQL